MSDSNVQTSQPPTNLVSVSDASVSKGAKKSGTAPVVPSLETNVTVPFAPTEDASADNVLPGSDADTSVAVGSASEPLKVNAAPEGDNPVENKFGSFPPYPPLLPGLPISADAEDKKAGGKWTAEVTVKHTHTET
jgi:hypothetical protein